MLKYKNGKFKIMQIADTQDIALTSPDTINFISAALDREKPDLVIFTGDQIKSYGISMKIGTPSANTEKAIRNLLAPLFDRNIPFTFTYGNHDVPSGTSKASQTYIYESYPQCVNREAFARLNSTDGLCFTVHSEDESKVLFSIFVIDSQAKTKGKYDGVSEQQIAWTEDTNLEVAAANGGKLVPTLVFQHIPVYEMYDILKEVPKGTKDAIEGNSSHRGSYYVVSDEMAARGEYMRENIACPEKITRQFDSWVRQKNILGAYFGHDHINCFIGNLRGVDLGYTPGAGFNIYGPGYDRAVRIFELDAQKPGYKTRILTYRELLGKKVERPVKFFIYSNSPSSADAAIPFVAKGLCIAAACAVGVKILKKIVKK